MTKHASRQSDFTPEDLKEAVGEAVEERRTEHILEGGITKRTGDMGPTGGVGLPETASLEELKELDTDTQENSRLNPSDLNDPGDPEAGDDGVPGGMEAGGEESLGGTGGEHREIEPWENGMDENMGFESKAPTEPLDEALDIFDVPEGEEVAED
jgi:hypothetical protein